MTDRRDGFLQAVLADGHRSLPEPAAASRISFEPDKAERGLTTLVLTVVELLRQLMERQALRRVEYGDLDEEQVEDLGRTLLALEQQMIRLREHFGLTEDDLNLDLGPLGPLLPRD